MGLKLTWNTLPRDSKFRIYMLAAGIFILGVGLGAWLS